MSKQISIAVVGLGRAGWNIHVEKIRARDDFKIVDVADPDSARRKEAAAELGCPTHLDLDTMLKTTEAEVVVVATPNVLHESDAMKVLGSGRHCVLEKPMSDSHGSTIRILEAARKADRKVFVHHQRRFADEFRFLREVIDSGILGNVFSLRFFWGGFARRNDWQTLRKNQGGLLNNHGPHVLDLVLNLLDAPVTVLQADLQHVKDAGDCEDHFALAMKASNGRSAEVTCSSVCAIPMPRTVIMGANGTLIAHNTETAKLRYYDPAAVPSLSVIEGPAPARAYGTGEELPWKEEDRKMKPSKPGGDFYDNVRDVLENDATMTVTPESAAEVIRVIEWAHRTVITGV